MHLVDTNVLVYAADASCPEHVICRSFVERWRAGILPWFCTWSILYEFLRVTTHQRVLRNPWTTSAAWQFIEALLSSPTFTVLTETPRHRELVELTLREIPRVTGNLVFDCRTAVIMREHGIRQIYTRDTDFSKFPFLETVDPLTTRHP